MWGESMAHTNFKKRSVGTKAAGISLMKKEKKGELSMLKKTTEETAKGKKRGLVYLE